MKNEITLILLLGLFLSSIALDAQEADSQSHSNLQQEFDFDDESGEKVIKIEVGPSMNMIGFNFQSNISSGSLIMSIFDPNGKREGGFTLKAHGDISEDQQKEKKSSVHLSHSNSSTNTSSNSTINTNSSNGQNVFTTSTDQVHQYIMHSTGGQSVGTMSKKIENPIPGTWSVNIEMKELNGDLSLDMMQQGQE